MMITRKHSAVSKDIARYLTRYGINPFRNNHSQAECIGHYQTIRHLYDGRELRVYFCDPNKKGVENPMRNSRLEIELRPETADQVGYETCEYGLTGEFDQFGILTGNSEDVIGRNVHFSRETLSKDTAEYLQEKYVLLLEFVHTALTEKVSC